MQRKSLTKNEITLVSKRVILRELQGSDAARLVRLLNDRQVTRYTYLHYPFESKHARSYLTIARTWKRKGTGFRLAIIDRSSGDLAGGIALFQIDRVNRHAEIGYWLGKPYWGMGLIDEAVNLVLRHAFSKLKLRRIYGHVWEPNGASCRAVERLGFTWEGTLRKSVRRHGKYLDQRLYAILREEFRNRTAQRRSRAHMSE